MAWIYSLAPDTVEHAEGLQLTNTERIVLAKFDYLQSLHGGRTMLEIVSPQENWNDISGREAEAYQSLCRMGYIEQSTPRVVRHATVEDLLSDAGRARLETFRARVYPCCSYAIRQPCVCMESVYCPSPEHRSGCHGTHD